MLYVCLLCVCYVLRVVWCKACDVHVVWCMVCCVRDVLWGGEVCVAKCVVCVCWCVVCVCVCVWLTAGDITGESILTGPNHIFLGNNL